MIFMNLIPYPPSDEDDSDDSEGENQELAQIDKERRHNCILTPLATNQLQNQENQCCKVRALFPGLDHHSSEEELERISREFAAEKRKWSQVSRLSCHTDNTSSSDEEVKHLCGMSIRPVEQTDTLRGSSSPVLFSASPPKRLQLPARNPASCPLIFTSVGSGFDQGMPCKRHRQGYGDKISRPSLDLEKMQQKMLFKRSCNSKSRVIKIRSINGGRQPPHYVYDPAMFAFRSLSTVKPISPLVPIEEPSCAY
ncbi:MGC86483 protein isoform X1 [Xenopus laevis]|uniref:MGC86483 protein isoform X1 n=1 Tax=Xenopus laevis TaxID=8355 RepID=A0A8J1KLH3_XENLA|nr:MGC86483 protein isoform X1 [Xenopus laevis]